MILRLLLVPVAVVVLLIHSIPINGGASVLRVPDQSGIPLLISRSQDLIQYGTGVVIGPNTILTAEHVTTNRMEVRFPHASVTGVPICRASNEDLAVIRATLPKQTPYYRLSFRMPAVGESVTVAGYPGRTWRVTRGRVTHVTSSATLSGRNVRVPMIVFAPALQQGASGSPIFDRQGLTIAIFVASNRQSNYSIGFPVAAGLRACRSYLR